MFSFGDIQSVVNFGRCQSLCGKYADDGDHALEGRADEKKDLRGGERKVENAENFFAHDACEYRTEHHAREKAGEADVNAAYVEFEGGEGNREHNERYGNRHTLGAREEEFFTVCEEISHKRAERK